MNPRQAFRVFLWLVRDTFRQSLESRVCWILMGLSGVVVLTCLSVRVDGSQALQRPGAQPDFLPRSDPRAVPELTKREGLDVISGELSVAFGAFRLPLARDTRDAVRFLEVVLAGAVAGIMGLFLTLIWTAGFLPDFLAPRASAVLLVKPTPRWFLFLGKYASVIAFVAAQTTILVGGTWLALGARTGIWDAPYLWCAPLLVLEFAVFFSISALAAAHLRGTPACALAALLFWGLCWGMNYGRHAVVALPYTAARAVQASSLIRGAVEVGYWILPKPADLGIILTDLIGGTPYVAAVPEFEAVKRHQRFDPLAAVATSLATSCAALFLAARRFEATDY